VIRNYRLIFSVLLILFTIPLFTIIPPAYAQDTKEPIVVNGDKVEYLYEEKKVVGVKNVVITYKEVRLTCDKIVVDMETKEAIAEGNVELTQRGGILRGEKVHYSFTEEKGTILKAEIRREPWYGKSDASSKIDDKEYLMDRGYITTCELPNPHYRIQARQIKMFVDERVEARHVIFFLGDMPIFYLPYYLHPLKDKRPRVTIVPGRNSRWGAYLLTAWRYYFHEWSRGYVHLDWREKKGFAQGVDYKYKFGYFGKGLARLYYTHEDHETTIEEQEAGHSISDDRWRAQLRHKWQIDKDTLAVGEFNRISDRLFIKDYYFNEEYEIESEPETYLSVVRTRPDYTLSLYTRVRIDDFFTVVEKLPEVKMDIRSQRLRNTNFYYKSTTSLAMLQKKFSDTELEPKLRANRVHTDQEISYLAKLFRFLTFNPYLRARETWYSEDDNGDTNRLRTVLTLGSKFSTKFFKVFDYESNMLGLDINGLRHIVTPSLDYRVTPTPTIKAGYLKQFDDIDAIESQHGVLLSVVNRLQTKRGSQNAITTLARLTTSTEVLIEPKRAKSIDDVRMDLELTPYDWLLIDIDSQYNLKRRSPEFFNTDIVAHKGDLWRLGLGFRFEDDDVSGTSSQITTDASYKLGPKWKLGAYHRYKKDTGESDIYLAEQNYSVERDLHCWLAELNYQLKRTEGLEVDIEHRIWLVMRLKAFPDLPFRMFSTRYSAPRASVASAAN